MSLGLNILTTVAIVLRLMVYRYRIRKALGSSYASHYTTVVAMLVESSALYSSFSLLFLVSFAIDHPLAPVFLQTLSQVQVSPFMLSNFTWRSAIISILSGRLLRHYSSYFGSPKERPGVPRLVTKSWALPLDTPAASSQ